MSFDEILALKIAYDQFILEGIIKSRDNCHSSVSVYKRISCVVGTIDHLNSDLGGGSLCDLHLSLSNCRNQGGQSTFPSAADISDQHNMNPIGNVHF